MLTIASYFQYNITKKITSSTLTIPTKLQRWNWSRSSFFLLQVILWCLNVGILYIAIKNIRNGLRSIEKLKNSTRINTVSLVLLLVAMATFSVSWFPLLYIEIFRVEDSGRVYLISILINICALFCGMCIMFNLLRRMSLDAIEQYESNEISNVMSLEQS